MFWLVSDFFLSSTMPSRIVLHPSIHWLMSGTILDITLVSELLPLLIYTWSFPFHYFTQHPVVQNVKLLRFAITTTCSSCAVEWRSFLAVQEDTISPFLYFLPNHLSYVHKTLNKFDPKKFFLRTHDYVAYVTKSVLLRCCTSLLNIYYLSVSLIPFLNVCH